VPALEQLSRRYREHHATRSPDFVYGGDERAELFRDYVGGPGRRVLDVGCRFGALTRSYVAGNEVVGLDLEAPIDRRDYGIAWQAELPKGGDVLAWDVTIQAHLELAKA
jgi:hypothetical protein